MSIWLPENVVKRIKAHEYIRSLDFETLKDNPMCTKCERVALRDKGYIEKNIGRCPHCGHIGPMTVTLKVYAEKCMYK